MCYFHIKQSRVSRQGTEKLYNCEYIMNQANAVTGQNFMSVRQFKLCQWYFHVCLVSKTWHHHKSKLLWSATEQLRGPGTHQRTSSFRTKHCQKQFTELVWWSFHSGPWNCIDKQSNSENISDHTSGRKRSYCWCAR